MHERKQSLQDRSMALLGQVRRVWVKLPKTVLLVFPRSLRPASNKKPHELHPTAYLDALRGYAAWIVYNSHVIPTGWRRETGPYMRWPIFNIWYKGISMVDIFFVISGFALSYSALGHMHNKQPTRILDSLSSSVFRRHLRLYLPLIFASFVSMLAIATGIAVQPPEEPQVLQPTFIGNLTYWIKDTIRSCDPFPHVVSWWYKGVRDTHTLYIPQAWTIPVEFRGSLILFIFCLAVCKMTTKARMAITLISCVACFWWTTPYAGLFLFGMWLADRRHERTRLQQASTELPLARQSKGVELDETTEAVTRREKDAIVAPKVKTLENWTWPLSGLLTQRRPHSPLSLQSPPKATICQELPYLVVFSLSIWLVTAPDPIRDTSLLPYQWIPKTYPPTWAKSRGQAHWPYSIGAMMMCYAIEHSPLLQAPLKAPFSQFLGELSFGIYIMHILVRWIIWEPYLVRWGYMYLGKSHLYQVPGYLVMTVIVFWAAEMFRRVDVKCVRFTKYLQDALWEH